jgi:hypothetical protein
MADSADFEPTTDQWVDDGGWPESCNVASHVPFNPHNSVAKSAPRFVEVPTMSSSPHLFSTLLGVAGLCTCLLACEGTEGVDAGQSGTADAGATTDAGATATDSGTAGTGTTEGVRCDFSQSVVNNDESVNATSTADWSCADDVRTLLANGLPDHEVGTFPNSENPNTITAQTVDVDFPLSPALASDQGTPTQVVAYALNGVKFEVGTAGTCNDTGDCSAIGNGGTWRMEAVGENGFDFGNDDSHGHVQPFGAYHYHGIPEGYLTKLGKGIELSLVGWAVDGFPIYARYGHQDPLDSTSAVVALSGSYQLKATPDSGRPAVSIYPMGAFTQDYEYVADSGDLDECNGRVGVTPEFPEGIYHYYLTDSFPFGQRCVKGTALAGAGGGPGGGGMGPPACADVPAGDPCCGDGICGGPETNANCSEDCD